MAGYDPGDPDAADVPVPDLLGAARRRRRGAPDRAADAVLLRRPGPITRDPRGGARRRSSSSPAPGPCSGDGDPVRRRGEDANTLTWMAEGYAYHQQNLVSQWETTARRSATPSVRAVFLNGPDYVQAQRVRRAVPRGAGHGLRVVDVLLMPARRRPPPRRRDGHGGLPLEPVGYTGQWNLAGVPACRGAVRLRGVGAADVVPGRGQGVRRGDRAEGRRCLPADDDWHLEVPSMWRRRRRRCAPGTERGPMDDFPLTIEGAAAALRAGTTTSVEW